MEIIPSFDLLDGKLVRLRQGDFEQKTEYSQDPLEMAKTLEQSGIRRLHMVDLDGGRPLVMNLKDLLTVGWKPVLLMVVETLFLAALFHTLLRWL